MGQNVSSSRAVCSVLNRRLPKIEVDIGRERKGQAHTFVSPANYSRPQCHLTFGILLKWTSPLQRQLKVSAGEPALISQHVHSGRADVLDMSGFLSSRVG